MENIFNPVAPTPPNFHVCDATYGADLVNDDCLMALARLPGGATSIPFTLTQWRHPVGLPIYIEVGQ